MSILSPATPLPTPVHTHAHRREFAIRDDMSGYVVAVSAILASQLSLFIRPELGAYVTVAALALLMFMAAKYDRVRGVILSLALLPLIGMVNLSLIAHSAFEQTAAFYISMLALSLAYRFRFRERIKPVASHMGVLGYAVFIPAALAVGLCLGVLTYFMLVNGYVFGNEAIGLVAVLAVIGAVAEESLFRGLIQRQASDIMDPRYAAILTSVVYAGATFSHFSVWAALMGAISTLALSFAYVLRPNLILTTVLNACAKLTYVVLIGVFLIK